MIGKSRKIAQVVSRPANSASHLHMQKRGTEYTGR